MALPTPISIAYSSTSVPKGASDYYGSRLVKLWRADLVDRLHGASARANARWGWLTPPAGAGKLIWLHADDRYDSVLLASELLRAIRLKRLDVRLALTFEYEYRELLATRLHNLKGIGYGYGPADRAAIVARVLKAFAPLGVIQVAHAPRRHLSAALQKNRIHSIAVNAPPSISPYSIDWCVPRSPEEAQRWRHTGAANEVAPPAAFISQLVEAQVDPNFKSLLGGAAVWWFAGMRTTDAAAIQSHWQILSAALPGILFVSLRAHEVPDTLPRSWQRISEWRRDLIPANNIVLVDTPHWLPAIANVSQAIHLEHADEVSLWQALAAGKPCSRGSEALPYDIDMPVYRNVTQVFAAWQATAGDTFAARRLGDALRRRFWDERRRAAAATEVLLQRIYDW